MCPSRVYPVLSSLLLQTPLVVDSPVSSLSTDPRHGWTFVATPSVPVIAGVARSVGIVPESVVRELRREGPGFGVRVS